MTKICSKCGIEKPETEEYFYKQKRWRKNFRSDCKECVKQYNKDNAERIKKERAQYYLENNEHINKIHKQWTKNNTKHIKEYRKQYKNNNKEKLEQWRKQYYKNNAERCKQYAKQYRKDNKKEMRADKTRRNAERRAMKLNQTPKTTINEKKKVALYYNISRYMGENFHVDHIIPLSKGGLHHSNNLQILRASLNMEKSNKYPLTAEEEIKYKGFRI